MTSSDSLCWDFEQYSLPQARWINGRNIVTSVPSCHFLKNRMRLKWIITFCIFCSISFSRACSFYLWHHVKTESRSVSPEANRDPDSRCDIIRLNDHSPLLMLRRRHCFAMFSSCFISLPWPSLGWTLLMCLCDLLCGLWPCSSWGESSVLDWDCFRGTPVSSLSICVSICSLHGFTVGSDAI